MDNGLEIRDLKKNESERDRRIPEKRSTSPTSLQTSG